MSEHEQGTYQLEYDGSCNRNPWKACAGALLRDPHGHVISEVKLLLEKATCNVAEYNGLILGLKAALAQNVKKIRVQGDSNLVYKQVTGCWKVRSSNLLPLHEEVKQLISSFEEFSIYHVKKEYNASEDALANVAAALIEREENSACQEIGGDKDALRITQESFSKCRKGSLKIPGSKKQADICKKIYQLEFDGVSKGNPGKAGAGALLRDPNGRIIWELMLPLAFATCNVAEYNGLIVGLRAALSQNVKNIKAQGDSSLICKQVSGCWKVRNSNLVALHREATQLIKSFEEFSIYHVTRKANAAADSLAKSATSLKLESDNNGIAMTIIGEYKQASYRFVDMDMIKNGHLQQIGGVTPETLKMEGASSHIQDSKTVERKRSVTETDPGILEDTVKELLCHQETKISDKLTYQLEYDGASKGNPGKSGAAALLRHPDGHIAWKVMLPLKTTTNNVAEYKGLIIGLREALNQNVRNIRVQGDSNLVCNQVRGCWKVRNSNLALLHEEANKLIKGFDNFSIHHVRRDSNAAADALANIAASSPETVESPRCGNDHRIWMPRNSSSKADACSLRHSANSKLAVKKKLKSANKRRQLNDVLASTIEVATRENLPCGAAETQSIIGLKTFQSYRPIVGCRTRSICSMSDGGDKLNVYVGLHGVRQQMTEGAKLLLRQTRKQGWSPRIMFSLAWMPAIQYISSFPQILMKH